jgi:hypothetical protein
VVSRVVELASVEQVRSGVESRLSPFHEPEPIAVDIGFHCKVDAWESPGGDSYLSVVIEFRFVVAAEDPDADDRPLVDITADYRLMYELIDDQQLPDSAIQCFAELNGPYNAWPYWREFVQSATGRIGMASVVLPVYRPVERAVHDDETAEGDAPADEAC